MFDNAPFVYSAIAAIDINRGIGKNGTIPWNIPEDRHFFAALTLNTTVIMGHRTHESLKRSLPNRENIVMTRTPHDYTADIQTHVVSSYIEAMSKAAELGRMTFIIGGSVPYQYAINDPRCTNLYLTHINTNAECDTYFPNYLDTYFPIETIKSGIHNGIDYTMVKYNRKA